jgi:hypothetical protein
MQTYKEVTKEVTESELSDVVCNNCECHIRNSGTFDGFGGHHFCVRGYYASTYPQDGDAVAFDLCDDCLKKIVDALKIPALTTVDYELL